MFHIALLRHRLKDQVDITDGFRNCVTHLGGHRTFEHGMLQQTGMRLPRQLRRHIEETDRAAADDEALGHAQAHSATPDDRECARPCGSAGYVRLLSHSSSV